MNFRELCDEVLASHREAVGTAPLSDADREEARTLLRAFAPPTGA